jgi:t-SNARE complex subunit (syntaxin)
VRWPRWLGGRNSDDTSSEARACLAELEARHAQVTDLGRELRERQRRNHFSEMVVLAISRASEGGSQ